MSVSRLARSLSSPLRSALRTMGIDVVRSRTDKVLVPRFACPSGHKLFDFRQEPGFRDIAREIVAQGRTTLDYNRLFVLWQAVRNTHPAAGDVAEVGSYRGGSARFLAVAMAELGWKPPLHVIDTFIGHPRDGDFSRDAAHTAGRFDDTNVDEVRAYLADLPNVIVRQGRFEDTCDAIADRRFALAHIDVDLYGAAASCLRFFWQRLSRGGTIVVDDYGFTTCPGLKTAVDEFLSEHRDSAAWYMHTGQMVIQRKSAGEGSGSR